MHMVKRSAGGGGVVVYTKITRPLRVSKSVDTRIILNRC